MGVDCATVPSLWGKTHEDFAGSRGPTHRTCSRRSDTHEASAQGHTRTGNEMLPVCRAFLEGPGLFEHATAEQALRAGFCGGYIAGILSESTEACVPPVSTRDAVRTVVEYLETHSEQLNNDFDDLVESGPART